ncbi:MAG: histidine kinase [Bacteroidetes bacterium]|nr:histidine kinase [Bacteroidota bacterium]
MMFRKITPLLFFIFILAGRSHAQVPFFKLFQVDKERNGIRVQKLIRDDKGFIWLGTSEGLYKFNGIEFSKITTEFVRDSSVTALFEDSHRKIWVGFRSGKIATIENNEVKLFVPAGKLPKTSIHAFLEDKDSRVWISTNGEGVFRYSNGKLDNISSKDGLSDDYTYDLALTADSAIWIGTDQGISICKMKEGKCEFKNLTTADGLPDNIVRVLLPDGNDNMWIGMQDKGICNYHQKEKTFVVPEALANWNYGQVNCLVKTENNLWIGTENDGIVDFSIGNRESVRHFVSGENVKLSKINDLLEDGEYNIWIADNNQFVRSSGEQFNFMANNESNVMVENEEHEKMEQFHFIHTLLKDHFGNLWFTPDQGLVKLSLDAGSHEQLKKFKIIPGKDLVDITALYEDRYGYLWIGTMGRGIYRMNILTGSFIKLRGDSSTEKASILSIAGNDDDLWFAGLEGIKRFRIENGETDRVSIHAIELNDIQNFGRNYVYSIFIDSRRRVWFGTDDEGLIVYDKGKFTSYTTADGLRSNVIYSVTEDPTGNIWFSTLKAGIYMFDGKTFVNYSAGEGLSDLNVYSIASDQYGNITIVNKHGIDVLDPATGLFSYYDRSVGIEEINADLNSITKDKDHTIWIGCEAGIIRIRPSAMKKIRQPQTVLNSAAIFMEQVDHLHQNRFSYDENNLTFSYNGLWFSDPEKVFYQYKLEGYNNTWISSRDRSITYPKLSPGKYTFIVRSSLNSRFSHAQEARYSFVITPPFWQLWWFKTIIALIGVAALRLYVSNRERRIKHLDQLQKEKIEFQFETLRNQVNPHFLFNSFNTLISIIEESPKVAVEYVERLSEFFRNIVMYREKDVITLKEEIELLDTYFFLQKKRYGQNLEMKMEVPEEIKNTRFVPPLTLQLLMENAVKHNSVSKETPLLVEIFLNRHGKLVIKNNTNRKITKEESSGMGLQNIISRFKLLSDRTVEIKSTDEYFEVSIPLLKEE